MTQEEKQLLLKDLSARLPYDTLYVDIIWEDGTSRNQTYVNTRIISDLICDEIKIIKPYLRPMSNMTRDEVLEYISLKENIVASDNMTYFFETYESIDYLNSHHFDYRGLIEKWLALEAPEGMYNLK